MLLLVFGFPILTQPLICNTVICTKLKGNIMLGEISSALSSLKVAGDIVKGLNSLKIKTDVKEKSTELLNIIIGLQQSIFSLPADYEKILNSKSVIEEELLQLKDWGTTKDKYVLKEVSNDVLAYVHKNKENSASEKHWLCANCFDIFHKESIYQIKKRGNIPSHIYYCPQCKNEILIKNNNYKIATPTIIRNGGGGFARF